MSKSETGFHVIIKGWIPTGKGLEALHEVTSAAMEGRRTGNYSDLIAMVNVEDATIQQRTRRLPDDPSPPGPLEEVWMGDERPEPPEDDIIPAFLKTAT